MTKCYNCKHKYFYQGVLISSWAVVCTKNPIRKDNFVSYCAIYEKCADKNKTGTCPDYEKSLRARLFGERP